MADYVVFAGLLFAYALFPDTLWAASAVDLGVSVLLEPLQGVAKLPL